MKLIIDIPEEVVIAIQNGEDYRYDIHTTIAQGKPFFPFSEEVFYKITDAEWEHSDNFWVTTPRGKKIEFEKKRPQGEWKVSQTMDCHSDIVNVYTCPFCGKRFYSAYPFCHCGADMRGE